MSWISGFFEVLKFLSWLVPILESIYGRFKEHSAKKKEKELRDAVKNAFVTGDTRALEQLIGNPNAGEPTRHNIPDLKTRPARDRGNQ